MEKGRGLIVSRQRQDSLPMGSFIARLPQSRIIRVPGMAVFMTGTPDFVPPACCTTCGITRFCMTMCCL